MHIAHALLDRNVLGCNFRLSITPVKFNDRWRIVFLQHLPAAVLIKVQLRQAGRINVFLVKIDIRFVLERLGIRGSVKTHQDHFAHFQPIFRKIERMDFLKIFRIYCSDKPLVFLRALLLAEVHGVFLERESRLD